MVEEGFAQIPSWHSAVDRVIPVAIRRWRKNWFRRDIRDERRRFRDAVQSQTYDAVIDAQGLIKSALLVTRLARGRKHGYDRHSIREPLASFSMMRNTLSAKHSMLLSGSVSFCPEPRL